MSSALALALSLGSALATQDAAAPAAPVAAPAETRASATRDLAALLDPIRERHDLPALAGAIVTLDGLASSGAVGLRRRGRPEPVTADDLFHLGSCTKAMTATLAGVLVERGDLDWNATVGELLGPDRDGRPGDGAPFDEGWRDVTLEALLAHQGGAPFDLTEHAPLGLEVWAKEGDPAAQKRVLIDGLLARPPAYASGTRFLYSNDGYALVGAMIERATGTTWREAVRELVFEPLGMRSAGFGPPGTGGAHDQPVGHRASGEPIGHGKGSDNPEVYDPAGRVHCTIADWARFVALHLRVGADGRDGQQDAGPGIVGAETLARLHAVHDAALAPYALGWIVAERPWGGEVLTHTGSNTTWFCVVWASPERGFAVLAATNQGGDAAAKACDEVASALIREHLTDAAREAAGSRR